MLELNKRLPVVRLYFNQKDDYPLVWSIDDGDQANEMNVAQVITEGVSITQYTEEDKNKNKNSPVAWLQFHQAEIRMIEGGPLPFACISNVSDY